MVSALPKRTVTNLTLVKPTVMRPRFLAPEALTDAQRDQATRYLKESGHDGMFVGALVSGSEWDIRPLAIEKGVLTVTRFTIEDPVFQSHRSGALESLLARLHSLRGIPGVIQHGMCGNRIWVRRRFYRDTLSECEVDELARSREERLDRLLEVTRLLKQLHKHGVFHGHLTPANVAWHEGEAVLLDYGFSAYGASGPCNSLHRAPELEAGGAGPACDLFGIGILMTVLLGSDCTAEEEKLIVNFLSKNPTLRPGLSQFEEVLTLAKEQCKERGEESPASPPRMLARLPENVAVTFTPLDYESQDIDRIAVSRAQVRALFQDLSQSAVSAASTTGRKISQLPLTLCAGVVVLGGVIALWHRYGSPLPQWPFSREETISYSQYWRSAQPSLMREVAMRALMQGDRLAQAEIVQDVLAGHKPTQVRSELIRVVFDQRWEAELSDQDRILALSLALGALIPEALGPLPDLSNAHPAVLFGIIGSVPVGSSFEQLSAVPVGVLAALPSPYGELFKDLFEAGSQSINASEVRALAQILQGSTEAKLLSLYFGELSDDLTVFRRLRTLLPVLRRSATLEEAAYLHLFTNSALFAQILRWFEDEPLGEWGKVKRVDRVSLVAGVMPEEPLSFEQYSDLLRFPAQKMRASAREALQRTYLTPAFAPILSVLSDSESRLSRPQTISILAALVLTGPQAESFFTRWFEQKPNPRTVLSLLLVRGDAGNQDLFNYKAAEYLTNAPWEGSLEEYRRLVAHPESLARALAYARLDPRVPEQSKLLRTMATAESSPTLRSYIQQRLRK